MTMASQFWYVCASTLSSVSWMMSPAIVGRDDDADQLGDPRAGEEFGLHESASI